MAKMSSSALSILIVVSLGGAGCVQRTLTVRTEPAGALVYLNDQEIGRSPVTRNFIWYGVYDVEIRLDGYESIKSTAPVIAPWWQWVPFDLLAEALPVTDHHDLYFTLRRPNEQADDPELIVKRGADLRGLLESSERPATQPTTQPKKHRPTTRPHTQPTTGK